MFKEPTFLYISPDTCIKIVIFYARTDLLLKVASLMLDADFRGRENLPTGTSRIEFCTTKGSATAYPALVKTSLLSTKHWVQQGDTK